jgi:hypothetical protein
VLTAAHREALSSIEYGIASRKGITLLVGEAGLGKTTVIRAALARAQSRVHCVHLHNPALTRDEFIEMLAAMFDLSAAARRSKAVLLLELESLLRQREAAGETTVLIVDEAQSLPLELLEEVRLLANIETNERKLLSVIMAGQPELAARLNEQALRQLKQRVALRCTLRPLTAQETAGVPRGPAGGSRRRRGDSGLHSGSGGGGARGLEGHPAHDQRDRRQRAADGVRGRRQACHSTDRARRVARTSTCRQPATLRRRSRRRRSTATR